MEDNIVVNILCHLSENTLNIKQYSTQNATHS